MLIFFTSLSLMNFPISFSALVLHFSLIYSTVWMWMGIHLKNGRLMAMFFKALCLVLLLSCYTLMIFLMMLYVILLSLLMILLSNVYVIRLMRIIQIERYSSALLNLFLLFTLPGLLIILLPESYTLVVIVGLLATRIGCIIFLQCLC